MSTINIPVRAYVLALVPAGGSSSGRGQRMAALYSGLAVPSFWSRDAINDAFAEANRIWKREGDIEFTPVNISDRTEAVPAVEHGIWIHFVNNLPPRGRGVGVCFVYDLPSHEGGWGGGPVALVSGRKVSEGLPGFAGNLLAHELGHVLTNDPGHHSSPSNLMYGSRHPRVVNAGLLDPAQVAVCRTRAGTI